MHVCVCSHTIDTDEHAHTDEKWKKERRSTARGRQKNNDKRQEEIWEVKLNRTERGNQVIYQWPAEKLARDARVRREEIRTRELPPGDGETLVSSRSQTPSYCQISWMPWFSSFHPDFLPLHLLSSPWDFKCLFSSWKFSGCYLEFRDICQHSANIFWTSLCASAVEMMLNLLSQVNRGNFSPSKYI